MTDASKKNQELGTGFQPKYDENGYIPCIATSAKSGEVLMFAFMNEESLHKTIETGEAHYWSRSRNELWHKGASSGFVQKVKEMRVDCDQDCIWISVEVAGNEEEAACHNGYNSCFYRSVPLGQKRPELQFNDTERVFDPKNVYGDQ